MDPSACPCLSEATCVTLRRGGWKAGVSMAPWLKLSWHLLLHQPGWSTHVQDLPRHRQELPQGLPLAHPQIPAAPREKTAPKILRFKLSYIMSRAKCHEAWVFLSTHNIFYITDSFALSYCRSTQGPNRAPSAWRQWKPCWFMRTKYWKFKTISAFTSQMDFLFALWLFTR